MTKLPNNVVKYFFLKDETAVKDVYNATYRLLFHIANSILTNKEDSEDVVSKTYQDMLRKEEPFKGTYREFVNYLCECVRNNALTEVKKINRMANVTIDDNMASTNDKYISPMLEAIRQLINKEQYDVFFYHAYYDLSFKDIAMIINKTPARCRGIYFETKKILSLHKEVF